MIQHNAIQSWLRLPITRTVIITGTGSDPCVEKYAKNHSLKFVKVQTNEWHTPLVSSIFEIGREHTPDNELLCYVNSDIILLTSFANTVEAWYSQHAKVKDVLLVGRRWDWETPTAIDFNNPEWEMTTLARAKSDGRMHEYSGIDYFVHSKTAYPHIYPFAIGRYFWDWWLVGNCFRRNDVMTIDISETAFAIHQNSPWFQGGRVVTDRQKMYQTKEVKRNHSFDNYGKNIRDGTRWESYYNAVGGVVFKVKS